MSHRQAKQFVRHLDELDFEQLCKVLTYIIQRIMHL